MLLKELLGVKKYANHSSSEIEALLKKGGEFVPIGKGVHASAFLYNNKVYKFWVADRAYEKFIDYVMKNQDNPWLPKLHSGIKTMPPFFKHYKDVKDVKWIKMEKLEKLTGHLIRLNNGNSKDDGHDDDSEFSEMASVTDIINLSTCYVDPTILLKSFPDSIESLRVKFKLHVTDKHTLKYLKILHDLNKFKMWFDLHEENLMSRGNQMVLIDPLKHSKDLSFNKFLDSFERVAKKSDKDYISGRSSNKKEGGKSAQK